MNRKQFLYNDHRADDDDDEKEEQPKSDLKMFSKRLEKYFFESRSVYLWGVVDDKSAKDIVSKLLLLAQEGLAISPIPAQRVFKNFGSVSRNLAEEPVAIACAGSPGHGAWKKSPNSGSA